MSDKVLFVPRTHCPAGHDLSVTGYVQTGWQQSKRCRVCDDKKRKKQSSNAAKKRWSKEKQNGNA